MSGEENKEARIEEEAPEQEPYLPPLHSGMEVSSLDNRGEVNEAFSETLPARASLEETIRAAREYAEAARAPNTIRAYNSDLEDFATYCRVELGGESSLPAHPDIVALYVTDMAKERGLATSTIQRRLASISAAHRWAGYPSPVEERSVRETMKGIRRKKGSKQKQAAPLTVSVLKRVLANMVTHHRMTGKVIPAALRDRALLLLGFAGSFRREELSALKVSDLEFFEGQGLVVGVRGSKTDPGGEGEAVGIPYGDHPQTCPITAAERWIYFAGRSGEDPLFSPIDRHGNVGEAALSGDGINGVVKKRVKEAGLEPDRYSGHSLRAGLPTSASEAQVGMEAWMPHTRHRSVAIAMRYARRGTLFTNNPAAQVGL